MRRWVLGACLYVSYAGSAGAAGPGVESLAWIAGAWEGDDGRVQMEEHWLAPKGGTMLGLHRDVASGRTVGFEFLRIETQGDGIVYVASPQGRPGTPFRLVESGPKRAVFENPEHDFPQRILYWLDAEGALHARIEGLQGGKTASEEWTWKRAAPAR
jgi:hypothetical protein